MTRTQYRDGKAAQWTSGNPILEIAEIGYETDTAKMKMGNGVDRWNDLCYIGCSGQADGFLHWGENTDAENEGWTMFGQGNGWLLDTEGGGWENLTGGGQYLVNTEGGAYEVDSEGGGMLFTTDGGGFEVDTTGGGGQIFTAWDGSLDGAKLFLDPGTGTVWNLQLDGNATTELKTAGKTWVVKDSAGNPIVTYTG